LRWRKNTESARARGLAEFEDLARDVRTRKGIHCLLAYSGGKDSTFTLMQLVKRFELRTLAITVDNGFMSASAFENARRVVEALDADHMVVKPPIGALRRVFRTVLTENPFGTKATERASSICTSCIGLVKSVVMRVALERRVPIVAFGWSPGQAPVRAAMFRMNAQMVRQMQESRIAPLRQIAGDALDPYFIGEEHFADGVEYPFSVNPLAFLDYDEGRICEEIKQLGWLSPVDTDGNSTNCRMNTFANRVHLRQYGFHPYAFEVAGLVRSGVMSRADGLAKLADLGNEGVSDDVGRELGVCVDGRPCDGSPPPS
jgi:3'-phosphoadenosine 5'-phosphosulfate sulfotransferase (PAPS reductase)/FAD synthetase